jgi:acylphosphatase
MAREAFRLIVEGRVQGVGYRWWAVRTARELGLAGWTRNRADGSVEILAIGARAAAERLAGACREGPSPASVTSVTLSQGQDDGSVGFEQRETV